MSNRLLYFDRVVYAVVAIPAIFFGSYVVCAYFAMMAISFIVHQFRLDDLAHYSGIDQAIGDKETIRDIVGVLLLLPSYVMTRRYFLAGWPSDPGQDHSSGVCLPEAHGKDRPVSGQVDD